MVPFSAKEAQQIPLCYCRGLKYLKILWFHSIYYIAPVLDASNLAQNGVVTCVGLCTPLRPPASATKPPGSPRGEAEDRYVTDRFLPDKAIDPWLKRPREHSYIVAYTSNIPQTDIGNYLAVFCLAVRTLACWFSLAFIITS